MNAMSGVAIAVACAAAYGVALRVRREPARRARRDAVVCLHRKRLVACHRAPKRRISPSRAPRSRSTRSCAGCAAAADRWFAAAFALAGLGMAAHPNALWILPAFFVGAADRASAGRRVRLAAGSLAAGRRRADALSLPAAALGVRRGASAWIRPRRSPAPAAASFGTTTIRARCTGSSLELTGSESQTPAYFLASFNPAASRRTRSGPSSPACARQFGTFATMLIFAGFVVGVAHGIGERRSCSQWQRRPRSSSPSSIPTRATSAAIGCWHRGSPFRCSARSRRDRRAPDAVWHAALARVSSAVGAGMAFDRQRGILSPRAARRRTLGHRRRAPVRSAGQRDRHRLARRDVARIRRVRRSLAAGSHHRLRRHAAHAIATGAGRKIVVSSCSSTRTTSKRCRARATSRSSTTTTSCTRSSLDSAIQLPQYGVYRSNDLLKHGPIIANGQSRAVQSGSGGVEW